MDSPIFSSSSPKNRRAQTSDEKRRMLTALIAKEITSSSSTTNNKIIIEKVRRNNSDSLIRSLLVSTNSSSMNQEEQRQRRTSSNQEFDRLFGNDDESNEENNVDDDDDDGVVWKCDRNDNEEDDEMIIIGNNNNDCSDEDEILNLDDDEDQEEYYNNNNDHYSKQETVLHQLGFHKRHALFCCAQVEPDQNEMEMWQRHGSNVAVQLHDQLRRVAAAAKNSTSSVSHKQETTRSFTPFSTMTTSGSSADNNNHQNSIINTTTTATSSPARQLSRWSQVVDLNATTGTTASHRVAETTELIKLDISPQQLFDVDNNNNNNSTNDNEELLLVSIPELIEFEYGTRIVSRIAQEVSKRLLSPQDGLILLWRIFDECVTSCGGGRILCSCITSLEQIIAFLTSHPNKTSVASVLEKAVVLLLKMFHDLLPVWSSIQHSPVVVSDSRSAPGAASVGDAGGDSVEAVLRIFVSTYCNGGRGGRRVLQIMDSDRVDPNAGVIRIWRARAHPFALFGVKQVYKKYQRGGAGNELGGFANTKEFMKLVV